MLKRQGVIGTWHDRRIGAGQDFGRAINEHVNHDEIILLLVSSDFIASDYCYEIEMKRAMERHDAGEAIVIPVILRACDWHHAPFGKLNATPRDGKPITQWTDIDEAFLQVAKAVREAAERLSEKETVEPQANNQEPIWPSTLDKTEPRSSNLRLAKTFSQRDKDGYQFEAFEYIARYLENSLGELAKRNPGVEGVFRRVDANRFFATVYQDGKDVARATIYMGGGAFGQGINYVQGHTNESRTLNESLRVDADDQSMFLRSSGVSHHNAGREAKLSLEGGAEFYWSMLVRPLQQR